MIKILFIHNKLVFGGAEQALYDLLSLMDKTKFDITVLVQYDGGIWEEKFRNAGFRVVSVWGCQYNSRNPFVKMQNLYKRKQIVKALERNGEGLLDVCLNEDYDIIVAFNGSTLQNMYFGRNAKTVKYIHGDMGTNPEFCQNILRIIDSVRQFDKIICVSQTAQRSFEQLTEITDNVCFHYNPLNSENVCALSNQVVSLPEDAPYICAVGRLSPEKGFDRLIRIHKHLVEAGLQHKLVIVGDGEEKEKLAQVIIECHAEDTVVMAGYQANPYPYMKNSRFLVISSYTEGLPVISMEALSLGIPVVATIPAISEAFGEESCGIVTENDDVSLESGIRKMFEDSDFYMQAKQGAEKRSTFFDGKRMVKEVEEELTSLLNQEK